ncbi:MAG: aldo/keto reductase, partial [Kiritimatiellia bacterium]
MPKSKPVMPLRDFGRRSGLKIAPVSIGGMRLPKDLNTAVNLVRHAIDSGVRYIDCSRGYGECEWVVGRALKNGYRRKVILSSKWAPWTIKPSPDDDTTAASMRRRLEESRQRLDTPYLDFFQVWSTNNRAQHEQATAKGGMVDGLRRARRAGLVKHLGFTTHDSVDNLLSYMDDLGWCESILVTYNLLNRRYAPVLAAAHRHGIGTLVMNPVGGGRLAEPSPVLLKLARRVGALSVPDLAVRYALSNPHVDSILCGMTCRKDIDDTIASALRPRFTGDQLE